MHRLRTLRSHRRRIERKGNAEEIAADLSPIRCDSINREIAGCDCACVDRVTQVHNELRWLRRYYAAAGRFGSGNRKTHQLSMAKGVLLGLVVDSHPAVCP